MHFFVYNEHSAVKTDLQFEIYGLKTAFVSVLEKKRHTLYPLKRIYFKENSQLLKWQANKWKK